MYINMHCVVIIMYTSIHKHTQNIHNKKCIMYTNIHKIYTTTTANTWQCPLEVPAVVRVLYARERQRDCVSGTMCMKIHIPVKYKWICYPIKRNQTSNTFDLTILLNSRVKSDNSRVKSFDSASYASSQPVAGKTRPRMVIRIQHGVAMIKRLLQNIGLFCRI